jgi:hypothetical protein
MLEQTLRHALLGTRAGTSKPRPRGRRYISNAPRPQAYLRPLFELESKTDEEYEGVMCLVMDRKEAKNALSVQMVGVCLICNEIYLSIADRQEMREAIAKLSSTSSLVPSSLETQEVSCTAYDTESHMTDPKCPPTPPSHPSSRYILRRRRPPRTSYHVPWPSIEFPRLS